MAQLDLKASEKDADMYHLSMSEEAMPLLEAVKKHIAEERGADHRGVLPSGRRPQGPLELGAGPARTARRAPRTRRRKPGLWNFFLPDADTGEGLKNLDYAYIAAELGK